MEVGGFWDALGGVHEKKLSLGCVYMRELPTLITSPTSIHADVHHMRYEADYRAFFKRLTCGGWGNRHVTIVPCIIVLEMYHQLIS